jgi:peptidyl-tRNA hydrolase, PTH1 family
MIKLVAGLGNPGKGYALTRHNIGFMVLDRLVEKRKGKFTEQKTEYHLATLRIASAHVRFVKPMTFMNLSGKAVRSLMATYDVLPSELLVVSDDFALPFGKLRLRLAGSDGGHNGLGSIIDHIGTEDFPRLRVGIGPVPEKMPAEEFVLEQFSKEELDRLDEIIKLGTDCLESAFYDGLALAMNKFNT